MVFPLCPFGALYMTRWQTYTNWYLNTHVATQAKDQQTAGVWARLRVTDDTPICRACHTEFGGSLTHRRQWGVLALEPLAAQQPVCGFVGMLHSGARGAEVERRYRGEGRDTYMLHMMNNATCKHVVDPTRVGNVARYVNLTYSYISRPHDITRVECYHANHLFIYHAFQISYSSTT